MTLEEFKKEILGADVQNMSQEKIEFFYNASVGLFKTFFDKWKKENIPIKKA